MAGMTSLHRVGRPTQTVDFAPPPQEREPRFYGNERLIHDFLQEHDESLLDCPACGSRHHWRKRITEVWERYDHVEFTSIVEGESYDHYATRSSADYYDDEDEDEWECGNCGFENPARELTQLLDSLDKENY